MALRVAPEPLLVALLRATWLTLSTAELGRVGEELAARKLVAEGWRLVGRNVRAPEAELDIVGRDGATLVVVEVKTGRWPSAGAWEVWRPGRRVTRQDMARRARAAHRIAHGGPWRVDVVEVAVVVGDGARVEAVRLLRHTRERGGQVHERGD